MMDILERLTEMRCDREPFTPEHADCQCRLGSAAAREIERLRELIAGTIARCEPMGYVGKDGQYLKQLRAAVAAQQ
jgi:hypothetical protein